ncbi:MAG TPA: hypothetical protein VI756_01220, partial [Blastocatellia bacterium]
MTRVSYAVMIASAVLALSIQRRPAGQVAEIGLYAPDLRAIQKLIGPGGAPTLPPGNDYNSVAKFWNQVSHTGQEFLLREPEIALVVVSSNGKWSYRSSGTIALRPLFNPGERMSPKDAEALSDILDSPVGGKLRDFYQAVLFGTGPLSPNGSRGGGSPAASYGLLLADIDRTDLSKEEREWFRRIVGSELLALDRESRDAAAADKIYGVRIGQAIDSIQHAKSQQLEFVVDSSIKGTPRQVSLNDLALPTSSEGSTELGPIAVSSVRGKKILSWS